jgi:hypothetical protein
MTVLAAGLLVASAGCEQSGEAGAPAADRSPASPSPASAAADVSTTPRIVSAPTSPLRIVFDPPALDFGYLPPNVNATGDISVRNEGGVAVKILQVKPTCKCTALSDLTGAVIEPGGAVTLTAELEGRAMSGGRKAAVRFIFEGYEEIPSVEIRAEVTLPVRASPSILNMGSGATTGHVVVESLDGRPFNILAANRQPPRYMGFDPEIDEPRSSYVLEWDLTMELAEGKLPHWWVIETDHPECPLVDSWVRHVMTIERPVRARPWRVADKRVLVGVIEPGQSADFAVKVNDIGDENIYAVRSLSSEFNATLLSFEHTEAGSVCTVRITPSSGHRGVFQGAVEFMAEVHRHSMDVVGKVAP